MTGADIVGGLLRADGSVTGAVAVASIKGGILPDGVVLPALLVRTISEVRRQFLKGGAIVRRTARVAVTVRAASYADAVRIMGLVQTCCADRTGALGGAQRVSVLDAGVGPDVLGPANSYEITSDFKVSYDAPA